MVINGRTDLASEVRRRLCDGGSVTELPGVRAREEQIGIFPVTTVEILDGRGARALGKPRGTYITMELPSRLQDCLVPAAEGLAGLIRRCAGALPPRVLLVMLSVRTAPAAMPAPTMPPTPTATPMARMERLVGFSLSPSALIAPVMRSSSS